MQPFRIHTGQVVPLDRANIDTDQIIPKQFLKRIERTGFGQFLFYDWRFTPDGQPEPEFVLNQPRFSSATIMVAGKNFGCGSSREHAPWALADYGIRAIIAPSFADIFSNNCYKNGLLPIILPERKVASIVKKAEQGNYSLTIDLETCVISDGKGFSVAFDVDEFRRYCLLEGLDDIGLTLRNEAKITDFEATRPSWR